MTSAAYRHFLELELRRGSARSIISITSLMLADAHAQGASDIHIDPVGAETHVRLRIHGLLSAPYVVPADCHTELIARLKILSGLRTDEHFSPQDGRFRFAPDQGEPFDARISILPSQHGESAAIRLLPVSLSNHSLQELGMPDACADEILSTLERSHGFTLIAGPTGSGKTTTLYACVRLLSAQRSIISIEDPIEYTLSNVRQVQVMPRAGLTFSEGLRAILRQDPDVIVIGEIRDAETAELAAHAARTGHLVLSTIHASDAASVPHRMNELGISPERFSSLAPLVIAQRLVRTESGRVGAFESHSYA